MIPRRDFLRTTALAGLFPRVALSETRLPAGSVASGNGLDPLVKVIEDTPREKLIEEMALRVRKGLAYNEALAALFVAAVRNVQPRPVGFKFHAVLAVNAAHLTAQSGPDTDRWLPIFWSLDSFKASQAEEKKKTGWTLPALDESKLPAPDKAREALAEALANWDVEGVDAPAAVLARTGKPQDVFEIFFRYGIRDFRDIGHKAIFVAGAWRLLQVIGWQHAEPILRSLAMALQYYTGDNPAKSDQEADASWKAIRGISGKISKEPLGSKESSSATQNLFTSCRTENSLGMMMQTAAHLGQLAPQSVWDALFPAGGEILMRRPGILSIHAMTTLNAMRQIFDTTQEEETRKLCLLQASAFIPLFRGKIEKDLPLDAVEPQAATLEETFAAVSKDKLSASRKVLGYLKDGGDAKALVHEARRLIFVKAMDAHDYKFSAAVLEDYARLSPVWRERFLAASVHHLKGSQAPDNGLVQRIRAAFQG